MENVSVCSVACACERNSLGGSGDCEANATRRKFSHAPVSNANMTRANPSGLQCMTLPGLRMRLIEANKYLTRRFGLPSSCEKNSRLPVQSA